MNATLIKKALEKVPNANVLINLVSRRVRQLNGGGGGTSRPLVADIALLEIIEEKMNFEMPALVALTRPTGRNGKRPQNWARA